MYHGLYQAGANLGIMQGGVYAENALTACQVAFGLFDWLTPGGAAALVAWLVVLSLAPLVRSGRLPFITALVPSEPAGDVETGGALRIVNGVVERR